MEPADSKSMVFWADSYNKTSQIGYQAQWELIGNETTM